MLSGIFEWIWNLEDNNDDDDDDDNDGDDNDDDDDDDDDDEVEQGVGDSAGWLTAQCLSN